jgi:phage terminase large subunit
LQILKKVMNRKALLNAYREHCRKNNRAEFLRIMRAQTHEHFWHLFDETHPEHNKRFGFFEGGRGGGRSTNISRSIVSVSLDKKLRIIAGRSFQTSVEQSCKHDIISQIEDMGVVDKFKILKRSGNILCLSTGALIMFGGFERADKTVKSMSKIDILWWEEADAATKSILYKIEPTIRKKRSRIIFSWNPTEKDAPIEKFKELYRQSRLGSVERKTNYHDNPWCSESLIASAELLKKKDYERYLHEFEGNFFTASEHSIFGKIVKELDFEVEENMGTPMIGIDWGFSKSKTTIVECYLRGRDLFVRRCAFKVDLGLLDTPPWLIKHVPLVLKYTSRADSARPETIDLCRKSIPLIKSVLKPPGSVESRVKYLQGLDNIYIHPECQRGTAEELISYQWKLDRFGEATMVPEKENDDIADAIGYAIQPKIGDNSPKFIFSGG